MEIPCNDNKFIKKYNEKNEETPKHWKSVTLNDVIKKEKNAIKRGPWGSSLRKEFFVKNGYKVYEQQHAIYNNFEIGSYYINDEKFNELKDFEIKPGDFIVSCSGTIGKISVIPPNAKKGIINQALLKISTDSKIINANFFQFLFQSSLIQNLFRVLSHGGTIKNVVSVRELKQISINLPPLPEQQKIALILSNVNSLINQTQNEIELTKKLKKGLMQELLTKGIGHTEFKDTKIGILPKDWEILQGKDVCFEIVVGIVIKPASLYSKKGVPCLRSFNIREDMINEKDIVSISIESNELHSKSKLKTDDVLIVRTGYPGTSCVVPKKFIGGNCVDLIIARPKKCLNSLFLSKFINSSVGKSQVLKSRSGIAQKHFNVGEMKNMLIPIPTINEQQKIISILSNIDVKIQEQQRYRSKLETLKKGLMQKLLTGEIRIKVH